VITFPLVTERLLIRPFEADDSEALLRIWGDPANERFVGATPPSSVDEVRGWIARGVPWGVWERETGELVGDCGLFPADGVGPDLELAYGFRRDRWGLGYATEAGAAALAAGFAGLGLDRVVADVDPSHAASVRVLEKLGFERVGTKDDKLLYAARRPAG
jgi:RimJ/RimL family protein N-acetyltransferase